MDSCRGRRGGRCGVHSGPGVASEGVEVDLGVGGAGIVTGEGETAIAGRSHVGSDGVGEACGGCVEE